MDLPGHAVDHAEDGAPLDTAAQVGLAGLVAVAAQLCAAPVAMIWAFEQAGPRALAQVGLADAELADHLARVAAFVHDGVDPGGGLLGAVLRSSDGRVLGGLCVSGSTVGPTGAPLAGLAQAAAALLELDGKLDAHRRGEQAAQDRESRLHDVIANVPIVVFMVDPEGVFTLSDGGALHRIGLEPGQVNGTSVFDVYAGYPEIVENLRRGLRGELRSWTAAIGEAVYETRATPLFDAQGQQTGLIGVAIDITERSHLEAEYKRLQEHALATQAATLAAMSTPLIPISRDTVVMPLIGAIDAGRAERVLETLLEGIRRTRARVAIVDITGVAGMDAQVADCLIRATRAVRLLGADVVLTGIRPEVAQALVELAVDLGAVVIRSTLESGIAWAMRQR